MILSSAVVRRNVHLKKKKIETCVSLLTVLDSIAFAVDCVVTGAVVQSFACDLVTCV